MTEFSGSILKEERKKRDLSQKQLAHELSISPAYVNLIENGNRPLTPQLRAQICAVLDIQESRLLGEANIDQLQALKRSENFRELNGDDLQKLVVEMPQIANIILQLEESLAQSHTALRRLSNRVGQDEALGSNLHELLSIATSIRSTSSILNTQGDITAEHSNRFHEILDQDATQLANTLRGLVDYLDKGAQSDANRISGEMRLIQYLEDNQYYIEPIESGRLDASNFQNWLVAEFGEEVANQGKTKRLFRMFIRDVAGLPQDKFLPIAQSLNWNLEAIALHFDKPMDRILRRVAMLSRFSPMSNVALYIQDQTGTFLLESYAIGGHRYVDLSCPFWPIFDADRERGRLYPTKVYVGDTEPIFAFAAASLTRSNDLPRQGWLFRTMLICRGDDQNPLANTEQDPKRVGFNCPDCRILDCSARGNRAVLLNNNNQTGNAL